MFSVRPLLFAVAIVGTSASAIAPAYAATITYNITFTATEIETPSGTVPFNPVSGSFTLTLDPLVFSSGTATLNSLGINFAGPDFRSSRQSLPAVASSHGAGSGSQRSSRLSEHVRRIKRGRPTGGRCFGTGTAPVLRRTPDQEKARVGWRYRKSCAIRSADQRCATRFGHHRDSIRGRIARGTDRPWRKDLEGPPPRRAICFLRHVQ